MRISKRWNLGYITYIQLNWHVKRWLWSYTFNEYGIGSLVIHAYLIKYERYWDVLVCYECHEVQCICDTEGDWL